jgi:hypothetical protein
MIINRIPLAGAEPMNRSHATQAQQAPQALLDGIAMANLLITSIWSIVRCKLKHLRSVKLRQEPVAGANLRLTPP